MSGRHARFRQSCAHAGRHHSSITRQPERPHWRRDIWQDARSAWCRQANGAPNFFFPAESPAYLLRHLALIMSSQQVSRPEGWRPESSEAAEMC